MTDNDQVASTEEDREAAAEAQGVREGTVPEQRPQAMIVPPEEQKSELTKRLEEAGDPVANVGEAHDQEAYDRAGSDAQMRKAAKEAKTEGLMVGNAARATKGPHEGRIFAITRILQEGSVGDAIRRLSGSPEQVLNSPAEVEGTAIGDERDGEKVILDVEAAGLEKLNEGWRGTRAGRRH